MGRPTSISDLRHRIALCSMRDVVEEGGTMMLSRTEVAKCWASIVPYKSQGSFIGMGGYVVLDPLLHKSHVVTIRKQTNVDITSAAWVYEERRISPPIWYKVLGFAERGNFIEISDHLHERSEQTQKPHGDLSPAVQKVVL